MPTSGVLFRCMAVSGDSTSCSLVALFGGGNAVLAETRTLLAASHRSFAPVFRGACFHVHSLLPNSRLLRIDRPERGHVFSLEAHLPYAGADLICSS